MKPQRFFILVAILALTAATLACNLITGKSDEGAVEKESIDEITESSPKVKPEDLTPIETQEVSAPTDQPDQDKYNVNLGDEYRSAEGGFAFQTPSDFTPQEFFGIVMMEGPDATEGQGPLILMMGGSNEEEKTSDQLYDDLMTEMELENDETVEILSEKEVTVDGHPGTQMDIAGQENGQDLRGRVVIVLVNPTQQFTMFGTAPADRWDEIEPTFEAVLASVYFFEPEGTNNSSIFDDTNENPTDNTSEDIPDSPESEPGDAFFMITDQDGNLIVFEEKYTIEDQYQSAPEETIIGLVSQNEEYTIILALPTDLGNNDVLALIAYDPYASIKAPSAAVYIGDVLYTAQNDGMILFDEITADTLTGTFFFEAVNAENPDEVISVMGTFVKLILPE